MQKITAVAFIYHNEKLLVAKRAACMNFMPNIYEIPGGHIEESETIEQGLQREIHEELGITINVHNPFHAFTYNNKDKTKQTVEIAYFCSLANDTEAIIIKSDEISEVRWIMQGELEQFFAENPKELDVARKGFCYIATPEYFVNRQTC